MHPLTTFPSLLTWGLIGPTLLRFTVGIIGLLAARARYNSAYKWASVAYVVASVFLILGLYTQLTAILGLLVNSADYIMTRKTAPISKERMIIYAFIKITLISLLFTGPGFFAFDLPL